MLTGSYITFFETLLCFVSVLVPQVKFLRASSWKIKSNTDFLFTRNKLEPIHFTRHESVRMAVFIPGTRYLSGTPELEQATLVRLVISFVVRLV